jgi:deoxyribodipyrimidine photo-lyase
MNPYVALYWSRRDFRLTDNQALSCAVAFAKENKGCVLPLFVLEDYMRDASFPSPQRHIIAHALPHFFEKFEHSLCVKGKGAASVERVVKIFEKQGYSVKVFVNEDVYPDFYKQIKKLNAKGVDIQVYADRVRVKKDVRTGAGNIYSIFTPFKNAVWADMVNHEPHPAVDPKTIPYAKISADQFTHTFECTTEALLRLLSKESTVTIADVIYSIPDIAQEVQDLSGWYMSEEDALKNFKTFLKEKSHEYKKERDFLSKEGTSKMSLALAWGFVSSGTLIALMKSHYSESFENPLASRNESARHYISELIWREFYGYLLYHYPQLMHTEFQERFRGRIRWVSEKQSRARFLSWVKGETGYAIVDAAMKQLARTGWMHNRARMIVASILTKNLGVDWRWGQEYFRAMLIDLDEASNNGGWQWGASVGADPKPIRIFNPYLQAENYDAEGTYQKKWLPPERLVLELPPLVEHKDAREDALVRYGLDIKNGVRDY